MTVIRLWGGLGNQMFQFAFGYSLTRSSGDLLGIDIRFYSKQNKREPTIFQLNIPESVIVFSESRKCIKILQYKVINKLLRNSTLNNIKAQKFNYLKEIGHRYCSEFSLDQDGGYRYYDGYWQTEKYFDKYKDELRLIFKPKTTSEQCRNLVDKIASIANTVAIHVRRGDYLKLKKHKYSSLYLLEENYYKSAIDIFKELLPYCQFVCFSDDIEWCKSHLSVDEHDIHFIENAYGLSDFEEQYLMSKCKNQIISNSTFSWWAAWLNDNDRKIVIAPNRWFGNKDIIPKEWIQI